MSHVSLVTVLVPMDVAPVLMALVESHPNVFVSAH